MFKVKTPDGLKGIGAIYVKTGDAKKEIVSGYQVQSEGGVKTLRPIYTSAVGAPTIVSVSCDVFYTSGVEGGRWEIIVTAKPAHAGDTLEYRLAGYYTTSTSEEYPVDMHELGEWRADNKFVLYDRYSYCADVIYVEVRSVKKGQYSETARSEATDAHTSHSATFRYVQAGGDHHFKYCTKCGKAMGYYACSYGDDDTCVCGRHK